MTALNKHTGPIGVFDSGLGGLSVLRHIRQALPHEDLLYVADAGFAPYGGRPEREIAARTVAVTDFLLEKGAKALVVACNTATAAAIKGVREVHPELPVVGVEPGLKPAAALTRSGVVGVMATAFTLGSQKFAALHEQITQATGVRFLPQACVGLVDLIEKGDLNAPGIAAMVEQYVTPLLAQGADTIVLGCTHYPFVQHLIEASIHKALVQNVTIVDTGDAVARQLVRLLEQHGLLRQNEQAGTLEGYTTGAASQLADGFTHLLKTPVEVSRIALKDSLSLVATRAD
ncbi:MAG TPA: glutamate racemase [Burkholderiaceae bacterium]